jgi:hypothetical protein
VDGNKRTGHAAMETCLVLNGYELNATVDEQGEGDPSLGIRLGTTDPAPDPSAGSSP